MCQKGAPHHWEHCRERAGGRHNVVSRDSTGLKVEIAFGCLVALLIGVGWLGLSRMGQINASTNRLFNERWEKLYSCPSGSLLFQFQLPNHRFVFS